MQRLLGISIYLLLMLLPTGSCNAASYSAKDKGEYIEESRKSCILSYSDISQDCHFEQPQNRHTVLSRQGKQQSTNLRINDSSKNSSPLCQQQSTLRPATYLYSCHQAVAATRHSRGYYIYALRHIII